MVGHNIWWQIKLGKLSFWVDNWTKLGALYYLEPNRNSEEEIEVKDFITDGVWNKHMYLTYLSNKEIVDHICEGIKPPHTNEDADKAWWIGRTTDHFSIKSAWQIVRDRRFKKEIEKHLSVK